MNDIKFKKGVKRSFKLFFVGIVVILLMLIYISISPKSKKTIYDEYNVSDDMATGVSKVYLETKGIKKEELEKYLSVAAILTRDNVNKDIEEKENYIYMQTVINFLSDITGNELEENDETEEVTIEAKKVEDILKEFNAKYIKNNLNVTNFFEYVEDELGNKYYLVKNQEDFVSYLIEISDVQISGDLIEVTFKNVFGTNEEITKLMNNEKVSLDTYEYKAIIKENLEYEYSKYYISEINVINMEKKDYNN